MSEKIEVILVDLGSTAIKSAEVIDGEIQNRKIWEDLKAIRKQYKGLPFAISTVRKNYEEVAKLFQGTQDIVLNHFTKVPIKLNYSTPETLGPDRIALAVGAHHLFPNKNNLVIDLGTCATMDVIDAKGIYQGGVIAPGLRMRMKAMAHFTNSLPDISNEWEEIKTGKFGKTTKESLLHGSYTAMINELKGTIAQIRKDFASINIILTGGDAKFFESRIKAHIFAGSKIVEIGLYRIWKYQ